METISLGHVSKGRVNCVTPHPTQAGIVLSGSSDCTARVWDCNTKSLVTKIKFESGVTAAAYLPTNVCTIWNIDDIISFVKKNEQKCLHLVIFSVMVFNKGAEIKHNVVNRGVCLAGQRLVQIGPKSPIVYKLAN